MNTDPRVLESMARIAVNEKPFMDWLAARAEEAKDQVVFQVSEDQLRVMQGRAQEVLNLKKLIDSAPGIIRKA